MLGKIMESLICIALILLTNYVNSDLLRDSVHVTSAAARPVNELWCYRCITEDAEDRCADLTNSKNESNFMQKCHNDKRVCMVKRFSYTTSNENSTTALKMWALERNCTKHCEPGCIIIGERTKLHACTSCCNTTLCNFGSSAPSDTTSKAYYLLLLLLGVNFFLL